MQCPICGSEKYKCFDDWYECEGCSVHFGDPSQFLVKEEDDDDNKPKYRPNPFGGRVLYGIGLPDNLY